MDYIEQFISNNSYRRPDKPNQQVMDIEDVRALVEIVVAATRAEDRKK